MSTADSRWNLRSFLLAATLYVAVHVLLRMWLSGTLLVDDAEQLLFARYLDWGYGVGQPPLYTWIVHGFFQIFGQGLLALTLVKYLLLLAIYLYFYLSARRLIDGPRLAWLAGASLVLVSPFAWRVHEGFTHTMMLSLGCIAAFHALLRLRERPQFGNYLLLGFWLGVGWLGKYSFVLFFVPLIGAALSVGGYRRVLVDRRSLPAALLMVLMVVPHLIWQWAHLAELRHYYESTVQVAARPDWWLGAASGVGSLLKSYLYYLTPLCLLLPFFPRAWWRLSGEASENERLLARYLLLGLAVLLVQVLFGATYFKSRWMHPVLLLFPLWAFIRLERAGYAGRGVRVFLPASVIGVLLVIAFRFVQMYAFPHYGRFERVHMPMAAIAEGVEEAGFHGGTIVVQDNFIGAHLALRFPRARIISLNSPHFVPPRTAAPGQCLLAWEGRLGATPPATLVHYVEDSLHTPMPAGAQGQVVARHLYGSTTRDYRLGILFFTPRQGECR